MKKKYMIRVYGSHDLDLITYIETRKFNLTKAAYIAVHAFVNKENLIIEAPLKEHPPRHKWRRVYQRALILDTDKDHDAVEMMSRIENGFRNSFLKNLIRLYLRVPATEYFLKDPEGLGFFEEKMSILRDGIRPVYAGFAGEKGKEKHGGRQRLNKEDAKNTHSGTAYLPANKLPESAEEETQGVSDVQSENIVSRFQENDYDNFGMTEEDSEMFDEISKMGIF